MSLDMTKSAGTITAQVLKVSHHGFVAARQRKMKRVRSPESSGTMLKTATSSNATITLAQQALPSTGTYTVTRETVDFFLKTEDEG